MPSFRRTLAVAVLLAPSTLALRGLSACLSGLTLDPVVYPYNTLQFAVKPRFGEGCPLDATYTAFMSDAGGFWTKGSLGSISIGDPIGFLFYADESGPRSEQYMVTVRQEGVPSESMTVPLNVIVNGAPGDCLSTLILEENGGRGASDEIVNIPFVYDGAPCGGLTARSTMLDANGRIVADCEASFPFASGKYLNNQFNCDKTSDFRSGQPYLMQVGVSSTYLGVTSYGDLRDAKYTYEITPAQQACADGLEWGVTAAGYTFRPGSIGPFVSTVKDTKPGSCVGHILKPLLQPYPSGATIECSSIEFDGNPMNGFVYEVRCPVETFDVTSYQMLGGKLDDFVNVPQSSVFPIYVSGQSADVYSCGSSIEFPALQGGLVDYKYRDVSKFRTEVTYATNGACDRSMYTNLELTQGTEYFACDTLQIDESGRQYIECDRVVGTMETGIEWRLEPVQLDTAFRRRDALQIPVDNIPRFEVIHSGELPQSTGDLRRRAREVRAGLKVPGGFTCRGSLTACPIAGRLGSWECVDTQTKLDACGGCPQAGGADCSELEGVRQVACVAGTCKISQCDSLHSLSKTGAVCEPRRRPRSSARRWSKA